MKGLSRPKSLAYPGKALALFGLLSLQTACALLLLVDSVADMLGSEHFVRSSAYHYLEFAIVVALVLGTCFFAVEIRKVLQRHQSVERTLKAASGAFHQLIDESFDAWSLTPSERDVALLVVKGLSITEIATARRTKEGTIKAQCNAIYRKAGVSGRTQLLSLFIDELMDGGLGDTRPTEAVASHSRSAPESRPKAASAEPLRQGNLTPG
jgi:DNA-binding CsgD family transcriptional regulator